MIRGLGVAGCFVVFWTLGTLLAWLSLPIILLSSFDAATRRRRARRVAAWGFRRFLGLLSALRLYRVQWGEGEIGEGPLVVVSNHPSLLDATALMGRFPELTCVVRASYLANPFLGLLGRACGHISGGGGSLGEAAAIVQQIEARLAAGERVLVFPEGTRSPVGGFGRFRRGAFEAATRREVPVQLVRLACTPPALAKGMSVFSHPLDVPHLRVHIHPPQPISGTSRQSCQRAEAQLRTELGV